MRTKDSKQKSSKKPGNTAKDCKTSRRLLFNVYDPVSVFPLCGEKPFSPDIRRS